MNSSRRTLTAEQYQRVNVLFDQALEVAVSDRPAWLTRATDNDAEVVAEVLSLLQAHDGASAAWERSAAAQLAESIGPADGAPFGDVAGFDTGTPLGVWIVGRKVAEGGMGAVFEGHRGDQAFHQRVAIKTLGGGLTSPSLLRRFMRERQILARLQHPNIAALYDGGANEHGVPYIVMEFVDGEPIDAFAARERLGLSPRLDLFRQMCAAIHYAHRNLVIHRDLKPGNILVSNDGVVKLLDFGIAALLAADGDTDDGVTHDAMLPLTNAYASPEQSRGDTLTTATDVYSAGVVLYRLLTGMAPYDTDRRTPSQVRTMLAEATPPLPSTVASDAQAVACGLPSASALRRALAGDLDAIVMMALRKEPERRYPSAEAFADDILRHLKGIAIAAKPDTLRYSIRRLVRRQRGFMVAATVAVASLIIGTAVSMRQARLARSEAARATRITQYLQAIVGAADPSHYSTVRTGKVDVGLMEVLDSTRARVMSDLAGEPRVRADLYWSMANAYRAFGRHEVALLLQDSARGLHAATVGDRSLDVARDIHFSGVTLQDMGRFDEAVARFRDARARYLTLRAVPDSEITDVETSLGQLLGVGLNKFDEGESLLRSAEQRELAAAAPRAAMTGLIQGALAATLMQRGAYTPAESAYRRSVDSYSRDSARARAERAVALVNWGMLLSRLGQAEAAAQLKRRALADIRASSGREDIMTVRVQQRLGDDLVMLDRLGEARALADSAMATLSVLPTLHPVEWTNVLRLRGAVAQRENRPVDAVQFLTRADHYLNQLSGGVRLGPEIALRTAWAQLHESQARRALARRQFEQAYVTARDGVGPSNTVTLAALGRLAAFLRRTGDSARADSLTADSVRAVARAGR